MDVEQHLASTFPPESKWLPDSPMREPAWRWRRAQWLVQTGTQPRRVIDDAWVRRARAFLTARRRDNANTTLTTRRSLDPAIAAAVTLANDLTSGRRSLLEANLLTPDPLEEVARRCGLQVDVVEAYLGLFFAVRDHPDARDWIAIHAVQSGPWNNFAGPQPAGLWRYVAFTSGSRALDLVYSATSGQPFPEWVRATWSRDLEQEDKRLRLQIKLTLAVMTERSPTRVDRLIALREQLIRLDERQDCERDRAVARQELMEMFLTSVARGRPSLRTSAGKSSGKRTTERRTALVTQRGREMLQRLIPS